MRWYLEFEYQHVYNYLVTFLDCDNSIAVCLHQPELWFLQRICKLFMRQ